MKINHLSSIVHITVLKSNFNIIIFLRYDYKNNCQSANCCRPKPDTPTTSPTSPSSCCPSAQARDPWDCYLDSLKAANLLAEKAGATLSNSGYMNEKPNGYMNEKSGKSDCYSSNNNNGSSSSCYKNCKGDSLFFLVAKLFKFFLSVCLYMFISYFLPNPIYSF